MSAADLTPAALAAQARELSALKDWELYEAIRLALGAVRDAAREQERDLKCAWDSRACEAHQPLYAEQEECPFCHTVKLAEEVRQLREALQRILHETGRWNPRRPADESLNFINELAAHALRATEPSHG